MLDFLLGLQVHGRRIWVRNPLVILESIVATANAHHN